MKALLHRLVIAALLFPVVTFSHSVHCQDTTSDRVPNDFLGLADLRGKLSAQIDALEREIKDIEARAPELAELKQVLEQRKTDVAEGEKKQNLGKDEQESLNRARARVASAQSELNLAEARQSGLAQKRAQLEQKRQLSVEVQEKIAGMLSPEQSFKRTMSITFAVLIAIVIVGFFLISWLDPRIRQAIFSGQAGIQFLTLFSLVIAIILFGITGILEGKELSALLGGLSGYILGRVTAGPKEP